MKGFILLCATITLITLTGMSANAELNLLRSRLKLQNNAQSHYLILDGTIEKFDISRCDESIEIFGNCMGANPSTPYLLPIYESHPNEYLDPYLSQVLEITKNGKTYRGPNRMDPTEARVMVITMPGRAAYFGYQTYIFSKFGDPYSGWLNAYLPDAFHPNPERTTVFNALSNPINNAVMENQLGREPWNQQAMVFISSADAQTVSDVKIALQSYGIPEKNFFIETMENSPNLGLGVQGGEYLSLIRYALPETEANKSFYDQSNILTFRVIATNRNNNNPYPRPTLDARSGNDESHLSGALDELVNEIKSSLQKFNLQDIGFINPINVGIDTFKCEQNNTNCLGETRDTDTYLVSSPFQMADNEFIIMAGVNHNKKNNSTYFSINLNDKEEVRPSEIFDYQNKVLSSLSQVGKSAGFADENYVKELDGSAKRIANALGLSLSQNLSDSINKLWVRIVVRNQTVCGGLRDCVVLSSDRDRGVALNRDVRVMRRVYLKPGTQRGPTSSKLLNPKLFKGSF